MKTSERNQLIRKNLLDMKNIALSQNECFTPYEAALASIASAKENSYREILLCIIVHMQIFPDGKASVNWRGFHPRGIYDSGPVKQFLQEQNIPHTKSGPLNISKAANINKAWADGRTSQNIANLILEVVSFLESNNSFGVIQAVGASLIRKMLADAVHIEALSFNIAPSRDPDYLTYVCLQLIKNAPDAGNTPQKIAALLLNHYHLSIHSTINITGVDDRASVTNTTSKKPGDINEEQYGHILKVYEISLKPFNLNRIKDSYDCIRSFNQDADNPVHEVIVICRPDDYPNEIELSGFIMSAGRLVYYDVVYYFWNIYEWIPSMFQRMTNDGKELFTLALSVYVADVNTSEAVKLQWLKIHRTE